jgi:Dolichyl-phosphate-mannose-protein mannosyltransferase
MCGLKSVAKALALVATILLAITLRVNVIHRGLWLDEAWVANSVLQPSWQQMFYYDRWVQTTPPLLLALVRAMSFYFGSNEISLRAVPLLAGILAVLVMAVALQKMFSWPLALAGLTIFSGNYYASRYAQQVKQYSTDLLVSCLFLLVLWLFLESERSEPAYWLALTLGTFSVFLSYTAVFWFPSVLVGAALKFSRQDEQVRRLWHHRAIRRKVLLAVIPSGAALGVVYLLFIRPNRTPNLVAEWNNDFLGSGGLFVSMLRFVENSCQLLFPNHPLWLFVCSGVTAALCLLGLIRALVRSTKGEYRASRVLVVTGLPLAVAVVASLVRQYPLLRYPRFILWTLPIFTVLLLYCLEPAGAWIQHSLNSHARILSIALPTVCVLFLLANACYLQLHPTPQEQVREAVSYLKTYAGSKDPLFITGADSEQFYFYSRREHWSPGRLYTANLWWPCCSRNERGRASNPQARGMNENVHMFVLQNSAAKAWMLFPYGVPGQWDYALRQYVEKVPQIMTDEGCNQVQRKQFDDALILSFSCLPK